MRKTFTLFTLLFAAAVAMPSVASAQGSSLLEGQPALTFKTNVANRAKEKERQLDLYLKSSVADTAIYIVVDDDVQNATRCYLKKANDGVSQKVPISKPGAEVKIYAKTMSFINMDDNEAYDLSVGDDGNNTIGEFRCSYNPITSLDFVNGMKALTYLVVGENEQLQNVNISNESLQRLYLNTQPSITQLTLNVPKVYEFRLNYNKGITSIDLSKSPELESVTLLCDTTLQSVILPESKDKLRSLTITEAQLKSFELTNAPAMYSLGLTGNKSLASVKLSGMPKLDNVDLNECGLTKLTLGQADGLESLGYLYLDENPLTELNLDVPSITNLSVDGSPLVNVDFSKLSSLRSLSMQNGVLETIKFNDEAKANTLSDVQIQNNHIALVDLPERCPEMQPWGSQTPDNYYAPQAMPALPTDINVGSTIDMSKYLYGRLYGTDSVAASQIKWITKFDEELVEGTDYSVSNGVYTFLKPQEDSVACHVENPEFFWFKQFTDLNGAHDYRLITNYIHINEAPSAVDAIDGAKGAAVVKSYADGILSVDGAKGAQVTVYDLAGQVVAAKAGADQVDISVPSQGVYIVTVGNELHKVLVK